tara:strand:- start:6919 stop:7263 length:345 start_codon:yes stop_codon:yes gene_type:complete
MFINSEIKKLFNNFNTDNFSANFLSVILNHLDNEENVIFSTPDHKTKISLVGHLCIKTFDGLLLKGKDIFKIQEELQVDENDFVKIVNEKRLLKDKGYIIESEPSIYVNDKKAT